MFILAGGLFLSSAEAASLRVEQAKVRVAVLPGDAKSGRAALFNPSDKAANVEVYVEDWTFSSALDGSKTFYPPGTTELSCARWISFAPAQFTIAPFGKEEIKYTVHCPQDAAGAHFAVMFFETALGNAVDEEGVGVSVRGRLGVLFYVEPRGTIKKEAKLDNLQITENGQAVDIQLDFVNNGNTDIYPEGTFYIMDNKGVIVARGKFEKAYTLPGDEITLSSSISPGNVSKLLPGEYDLVITIDLGDLPKVVEAELKIAASGKISCSLRE
ncbi:MAG: hypothetical protein V1662_05895 [Candidatus Omnitrophota bacterium]